jgi:hypothetical protein
MRIAGLAVLAESQLARGDIAAAAEAVDRLRRVVGTTYSARTHTNRGDGGAPVPCQLGARASHRALRGWTSWRACTGSVEGGEAHLGLHDSPCHQPPMSSMPRPAPRSRLSKP